MVQSRVSLDVQSYSVMINGLCKSKMVDEALNLFEEMRCKYLVPNTVTYNTLIDGLSKSKRISCALELLVEMYDRGQPADVVTYSSLLDGMFKNQQLDKALIGKFENAKEIFQDLSMKGYRPNVRTYTIMINGFCKEGLLHEALELFSKMEDNGCLPDAVTYEITIRTLFEKVYGLELMKSQLKVAAVLAIRLLWIQHSFCDAEDSSESLWTCICDTNDFPKVAVGGCSSSYFNPATASRVSSFFLSASFC
ncbi:Pentatricopeptide repeat-containing protein [Arachis hypogaea]|nr:Pentatricopeptide repeat-containing protein [Arachis hypogaea]